MRFSFWMSNGDPVEETLRSGVRAEESGWDGLWFADHFLPFQGADDGPIHEVWSMLSALSAVTSRVRLGPLVCGNTYRNPLVLAKQAVTTDHLSQGRVVLGLGTGWQENEHTAFGLEFGSFSDRFERLEEALLIIRAALQTGRATLDGSHYQIKDAPLSPGPVGKLPILLGGGGEKKTLRMVAEYADEWNVWSTPQIMADKAAVLAQHCERAGRDPATIERSAVALLFLCENEEQAAKLKETPIGRPSLIGTLGQLQDEIEKYQEAGATELIVPDFTLGSGSQKDEALDYFLTEVAAPFR